MERKEMYNRDNYNFQLLSKSEKTFEYINKYLVNYPKSETVLKNQIEITMYDIIECIHGFRLSMNNRVKESCLYKLLIKLSMLDYYIRVSFNKHIINSKRLVVIGNYLLEIKKISYGLLKYEK